MKTMTHSLYGRLLNGTTADLVENYRYYSEQIAQIDNASGFADAYSFECNRNDRIDYAKRLRDLSAELTARFNNPLQSYVRQNIIREDSVDFIAKYGARFMFAKDVPAATGRRTHHS